VSAFFFHLACTILLVGCGLVAFSYEQLARRKPVRENVLENKESVVALAVGVRNAVAAICRRTGPVRILKNQPALGVGLHLCTL